MGDSDIDQGTQRTEQPARWDRRQAITAGAAIAGAAWVAPTIVSVDAASAATAPPGFSAYVANYNSNSLSRLDTATNTVTGSPIPVGTNPRGLVFWG